MALSWTLDKLGPLCLTADDCGLVLEAISGHDTKDQSTTRKKFTHANNPTKSGFKLAILKNGVEGVEESVSENFKKSIKTLENLGTVEELEFPEYPYEHITRTILNAETASAFDEFTELGLASQLTAPEDHYGPYARTVVLAKDYLKALRLREKMCKITEKVLGPYDALVAPGRSRTAPPIDQEFRKISPGTSRDIVGAVGNGAGLPSIAIPNGFNEKGLPTSIQFMGRPYCENSILAVAHAYQGKTDWHKKHPGRFTV